MYKNIVFTLGLCLVGCSGASSQWDAKSSAELKAEPQRMLHDLDAGDMGGMLAMMDDDSIVLDLDENNRPVRYQGKSEVTGYLNHLVRAMKTEGLKLQSKIVKDDCEATTEVGFCVVEFDQTISTGKQTMGPFKFRATVVARRVGDGWRWTHWHGSLRETPAQSPAG